MVRDNTGILSLLIGTFSGHKDEYRREKVPPLPLSFDRVNEGRPPSSTARLFKLPFEILALMIQYVPAESLALFALVNRDCRQLARSRQFASVQLDYGDSTWALIKKLLAEQHERLSGGGCTLHPLIGACIRRITVSTNPGWITHRHNVELDKRFTSLEKGERNAHMKAATDQFFDVYVPAIQVLLSDPNTLPHLELLDWEDKIALGQDFFSDLTRSRIQHMKLYRVNVMDEFKIEAPAWPLRTLHLEITPHIDKMDEISIAPICASILRLCAPTLQSLTWHSVFPSERHAFESESPIPRFTSLRYLNFEYLNFADTPMLEALVQDGIRTLDADTESSPACTEFFQKRGAIQQLETFRWNCLHLAATESLDFLEANSHIMKLDMARQVSADLLENRVLPLLSKKFSNLTSLGLVWEGVSIPESALEIISTLQTLEQLHLSAGCQFGWKHDWLIDHDSMRAHLRKLPLLKKLAFTRDSYEPRHPYTPVERYYETRLCADADGHLMPYSIEDHEMWLEHWHCSFMKVDAMKYLQIMPKLEWLYLGQLPMAIADTRGFNDDPDARGPIPLSQERDSLYTELRKMFGGLSDF